MTQRKNKPIALHEVYWRSSGSVHGCYRPPGHITKPCRCGCKEVLPTGVSVFGKDWNTAVCERVVT